MTWALNSLGMRVYTDSTSDNTTSELLIRDGLKYNAADDLWYGTSTLRLAATIGNFQETTKVYETDTGLIYILFNNVWVLDENQEITKAIDEATGDMKDLTSVQDSNSKAVLRVVDAAPFAYDEVLDTLKTSQYCTNADNKGNKHHLKSAATTNATLVKASPGRIHMMNVANLTAAVKFLKLYNLAVAPTVGTSVPFMVIPIQANTTLPVVHTDIGIYCSIGISYAITGAVADADTTAVGANEVLINMIYA